jgi:glutamine amidotransferase-like uncharacterized protein
MKTIALFNHHPECSDQCCSGAMRSLSPNYQVKWFTVRDDLNEVLSNADAVFFPGGIGDSDSYFDFYTRTKANAIANFVLRGGRYIGVCMGAYWAGSRYFDLLDRVDAVQYIKRPTAEIRRSYGTVADIEWLGQKEKMFFYDGCTFVGPGNYDTVAKYANDEPMAIIQGNVGIIGCHPESEEFWYEEPYQYLNGYYHDGKHHNLLLDFVNRLWKVGREA